MDWKDIQKYTKLMMVLDDPTEGKLDLYDGVYPTDEIPGLSGTHSLFNTYTVFSLFRVGMGSQINKYNRSLHYDIKNQTELILKEDDIAQGNSKYNIAADKNFTPRVSRMPTAKQIIDYSREQAFGTAAFGPVPYSWNDFLYCKWYGKIPNNHLITLRRYFMPVYDNLKDPSGDPMLPVAQAVTFLGEETGNKLSDIMKFSYGLVWKEIEAKVQEVDGNERGSGSGAESLLGSKGNAALGTALTAMRGSSKRWSRQSETEVDLAKKAWGDEGPYWNQVYGPVNVVHKSHMRERGMNFKHDVKIKFEYSLKSFSGVNPKVAMLDLMSNFFIMTYNNAKFWGGAMRYFPNYKDSVGFFGDQNAFYNGDWGQYFSSMVGELSGLMKGAGDLLGKLFSGGASSIDAIKKMISDGAGLAFGKMASQSRPHMLSIRSLLSGEPIGAWHLTIGNPLNPIAVMGNMIVTDTEFEMGEMLGADDFPTEITFTVSLKHGKPRDKGDMESMFNLGSGNMTFSPFQKLPSEKGTFGEAWQEKIETGVPEKVQATDAERTKKKENMQADLQGLYNDIFSGTGVEVDADGNPIPVNFPAKSQNHSKNRIKQYWGEGFAGTANLAFVFGKAKAKF